MISNETLLYGGIAVAGVALALLLAFLAAAAIGKVKLEAQFDREYGERSEKAGKR